MKISRLKTDTLRLKKAPTGISIFRLPKIEALGLDSAVTLLKKQIVMKPHVIYTLQSIEEKIELLMRKGEFAMSYEALDHETWLYALDGQLVEIVYSIVFNRIEDIRVVEDQARLDMYLENIDITELIN
jgi:hypothetical protein